MLHRLPSKNVEQEVSKGSLEFKGEFEARGID